MTDVQFYAPTNDASEDEKDQFYYSLKTVVEEVPTNDVLVVIGDLNAEIGNENAEGRRLRRLGHILRMPHNRIRHNSFSAHQAQKLNLII